MAVPYVLMAFIFRKQIVSLWRSLRRKKVKQQSVDYLGGSCSKCGYNKCLDALEFHHIDPSIKDKKYSHLRSAFSVKLKLELDKCMLLCSNCHKEVHGTL